MAGENKQDATNRHKLQKILRMDDINKPENEEDERRDGLLGKRNANASIV